MAEPVLNVVAKNPEIPHVSDQLKPAAVQKHGCDEWQSYSRDRQIRIRPGENRRGDYAIMENERLKIPAKR